MTDFYEDAEPIEPIEPIEEIRSRPPDFVTIPPDLRITIFHRENGRWWTEIDDRSEYVAWDVTFDGLCELVAEGLHLLGLNRERSSITILECPSGVDISAATPSLVDRRVFMFRERAS